MTRNVIALAIVSGLLAACGATGTPASKTARAAAPAAPKSHRQTQKESPDSTSSESASSKPRAREVGDFVVHRYTGSYRKTPLMVTEEIVAREGDLLVIEYTFEEAGQTTKLRARVDPQTNEPVRMSKVDKDAEIPMSRAAFDAFVGETSFAADSNDGKIDSTTDTCLIGTEEHSCESTRYHVKIGARSAKMTVTSSPEVASGDVSGEIVADDGTVVYRGEIVEMGYGNGVAKSVAENK